jgi:ribosomal protein S18 acetylase RimI-like enzyme
MARLRQRGAPGAHVGVSALNASARGFYKRLGFRELVQHDGVIYMGKSLR